MYVSVKLCGVILVNRCRVDLPTTEAETPVQLAKQIRKDTAISVKAKPSDLAWAVFPELLSITPTHKSANW